MANHIVYQHLNWRGDLLYVGRTMHPMSRQFNHADTAPWFKRVRTIKISHHDNIEDAKEEEIHLIRYLHPRYNKEYNYPSFRLFVYHHARTNDDRDEFIEDAQDDRDFPIAMNWHRMKSYFTFKGTHVREMAYWLYQEYRGWKNPKPVDYNRARAWGEKE